MAKPVIEPVRLLWGEGASGGDIFKQKKLGVRNHV
jgi:hypothetical protein